ncbi:uncharacterized protein Z519_05197 [Cladophialophora bantiana CBS 173.52]|uniref:Uncharacterized protein n=1 Tax=Cladophialophora bantiana (strain ATCC 10958 / CBS 173.52 / CDC B-1940 / NIH 8579) TaxID=1442370 RepID=A0A0D2G5H7_CLAB1|nr:uncharacterized protein Z519_05197 [Cladophialophora bantiana CBS 173.52]KIW93882.1 hypothetical protein Z519_05197 [Cladophialophora bantiana CBS 173.52]
MGKLRSPASPTNRGAPSTFPRMDPPPPYEESSRSSSAHSNDRLQGEEPARSQGEPQPAASQPQPQPEEQQAASGSKLQVKRRMLALECYRRRMPEFQHEQTGMLSMWLKPVIKKSIDQI